MPDYRRIPFDQSPYQPGPIGDVSMTVGSLVGDTITVAVQLKTYDGKAIDFASAISWYLSTLSTGLDVVATAPNGGVSAGTDGAIHQQVTGKSGIAITEADGQVDIVVTDTGSITCYLVLMMPDGSIKVSGAIAIT